MIASQFQPILIQPILSRAILSWAILGWAILGWAILGFSRGLVAKTFEKSDGFCIVSQISFELLGHGQRDFEAENRRSVEIRRQCSSASIVEAPFQGHSGSAAAQAV
jgi:hypothetical protein